MAKSPYTAFLATANSLCMNVKVVNVSSYEGAPDASFFQGTTQIFGRRMQYPQGFIMVT